MGLAAVASGALMTIFSGVFSWLTTWSNWTGSQGVLVCLRQHVELTVVAVGIACLIGIPLGVWLGHIGRGQLLAINVVNIGRAIPAFALLVLLYLTPLGTSSAAVIVALTLFALPAVFTSTVVGVREVDPDMVDAARGMGMKASQTVRRVEFPLAVPSILGGVRIATVQVIATATIAALVSAGGLGQIITLGYAFQDRPQLVSGALLVAAVALIADLTLGRLHKRVEASAKGQHGGRRGRRRERLSEQTVLMTGNELSMTEL
jgi:osmoprotectant transport system permease protein